MTESDSDRDDEYEEHDNENLCKSNYTRLCTIYAR